MKRIFNVNIEPNVGSTEDEIDLHELNVTCSGNSRILLHLKSEELAYLSYKILQFLREES